MDPLDFIERLSRRAREEAPPKVDVTNAVMRRILTRQAWSSNRLLPFLFAVSTATAAAVVVVLQSWLADLDPYWEFLNSVRTVMQW